MKIIVTPHSIKPCPFCGQTPTDFGEEIRDGKKEIIVIHPRTEGIYCPLNILVFPLKSWNNRFDFNMFDEEIPA